MYGDGRAEELVAEAIAGRRDETFLVSKVLPRTPLARAIAACNRSLRRLRTDRLDLYLLHWRGSVPLAETIEAFMALKRAGKIRAYGVSNLDLADMEELWSAPGGPSAATDQVLYNLTRRGIEWDLLPWLRRRGVPLMAYSPIEQGALAGNRKLDDFARRRGMTPAQAAIAWLLANDDVIVIPKTGRRERLKENLGAGASAGAGGACGARRAVPAAAGPAAAGDALNGRATSALAGFAPAPPSAFCGFA